MGFALLGPSLLEWTADVDRRAAAGIPETIGFLTKPEIALEQIRSACAAGLPRGVVLMDAGYGTNTWLREEVGALGLTYIAGIPPQSSVWPPGAVAAAAALVGSRPSSKAHAPR